ncbi:head GIN domain-containing protein [Fulvivirga kasyanovii]|uniref:DUF2807 domain-containing protein n=1 Tax=Fulvivirga kasyanovii TaxID=396812 RepID=A0ABW9RMG4_9BACT|nr:head GIN domain-containing protein [Fulvivirga kasyanovii]MTI25186.1 DUF2807 domain-containing protein [Fulvivirga kasyanovii]
MKLKLLLTFVALAVTCSLYATDKDPIGPEVTRKTLELPAFHSIYVNSNYTVYLKQTNKQEVTVEALTEIYEISEFKVEDGVLHINVQRKKDEKNKSVWAKIDDIKIAPTMKLIVSMRDVHELKVNSSGKIISENSIASNDLDIAVTGSGSMDLDIKGRELKTKISGSGSITVKGYASDNDVSITGSGSFHAFDCELEQAEVHVSGSGVCEIKVSDTLEAEIYGSGTIKHKGNTKSVTKKVYGSGEVERAY